MDHIRKLIFPRNHAKDTKKTGNVRERNIVTISTFFKRRQAGLRWAPALFFAIVIFAFSATPGDEIGQSYESLAGAIQSAYATPTVKTLLSAFLSFPKLDWLKVGHGIGYFCLGWAVLYALTVRSRWSPSIALFLCLLYSVSDEFHQIFVPGRSASARDILIDSLAALGGVAFMLGVKAINDLKRGGSG